MRDVVGVAIVEDGRVMAARRGAPPELAGLWEFPGGKVEAGETPGETAVREVAEELGCTVEVSGWLSAASAVGTDLMLRVATAFLVEGDPVPTEHTAVRWLPPDRLDELAWVSADLPFVEELRARRVLP